MGDPSSTHPKRYAVPLPAEFYRSLREMSDELGCEPSQLIRESFKILLMGYVAQKAGGGVFIKSESQWEQGIQQRLGEPGDLEGFFRGLGIDWDGPPKL